MKQNFFTHLLSEHGKASTIRLLSILMFVVAAFFLFVSLDLIVNKIEEITAIAAIYLVTQNLVNFLFAFAPKIMQKKLEQLNVNKIVDKT